jgi:hypothetical protein
VRVAGLRREGRPEPPQGMGGFIPGGPTAERPVGPLSLMTRPFVSTDAPPSGARELGDGGAPSAGDLVWRCLRPQHRILQQTSHVRREITRLCRWLW